MNQPTVTDKELEAILLLADGVSMQEIADRLGIHYETAKKRLSTARSKFGAVDNANLMLLAGRAGLLEVPDAY